MCLSCFSCYVFRTLAVNSVSDFATFSDKETDVTDEVTQISDLFVSRSISFIHFVVKTHFSLLKDEALQSIL